MREIDDAVIDKLVCDVHEIHARICDAALFPAGVWAPGHEPRLREGMQWSYPADSLFDSPWAGGLLVLTALGPNRFEARFRLDGQSSRPMIFAMHAAPPSARR